MQKTARFLIIFSSVVTCGLYFSQPDAQAQNLIWPAQGCTYISSPYGPRGSSGHIHSGTDISCGGTINILAAADGTVVNRTYSSGQCSYSSSAGTCPKCDNSSGNSVRIDHGGGLQTNYLHMKKVYVSKGDHVTCGQVIGIMGTTGCSTGQHLHFMVYDPYPNHKNPMNYVKKGNYTCPVTCTPSTEVCDGQDNDCDGAVDEDGVCEPKYEPMYQSMNYDPQNTDIDGDGKADICARGVAGVFCTFTGKGDYTARSVVLELSNDNGWDDVSNYATIRFADVNGDGNADLCARANVGIMCWLSIGEGFEQSAGPVIAMSDDDGYNDVKYYSTIRSGDINGDGRDDICARFKEGFRCYPSTGDGWGDPIELGGMAESSGWGEPKYYSTIRMADVNGDGNVDVCARGTAGFRCWISSGTAFAESYPTIPWSNDNGWGEPRFYATIRMADLNGDGMADVCARDNQGITCHLSTGTGWSEPFRGPNLADEHGWGDYDNYSTMYFGDINGDSKDDLCIRANANLSCFMSTGNGFDKEYKIEEFSDGNGWNKPAQYRTIRVGDINGDGKMDVCGRGANGVRCFLFNGDGFDGVDGPPYKDESGWGDPKYYSTMRLGGPLIKTCTLQKEICDGIDNNCNGQADEDNVCCVPTEEVCDGQDNDCDGEIDEGLDGVACTIENEFGSCTGVHQCNAESGLTCVAQTPAQEVCDGEDNDCDGEIDEDDVCCEPNEEVCDGEDNDCDGEVDEEGVCDIPEECTPTTEVCDGKDNDCDGKVDEGNVCNENSGGENENSGGEIDAKISLESDNCSGAPMNPASHHGFGLLSLLAMLGLALRRKRN